MTDNSTEKSLVERLLAVHTEKMDKLRNRNGGELPAQASSYEAEAAEAIQKLVKERDNADRLAGATARQFREAAAGWLNRAKPNSSCSEAEPISRLWAEILEENEQLRKALIQTGRNIGALLADNVSSSFLSHIPEEARLKVDRLTRNLNASQIDSATGANASREIPSDPARQHENEALRESLRMLLDYVLGSGMGYLMAINSAKEILKTGAAGPETHAALGFENARLRIALADAIRRPMGVLPESAVGLLSHEELSQAEERRLASRAS